MNVFSQTQRYKALFWLSLFHLLVITSSNYLVQLPVSIFGFHTTWGAFSFPFNLSRDRPDRAYFWRTAGPTHYLRGNDPCVINLLCHLVAVLYGFMAGIRRTRPLQPVCRPYRHRQFHGLRAGANPRRARFLTACVKVAAGGWHRQHPHCSVTSVTRWPFSSLPSGVARMPLWLNTGWKSRWSITVSKC